MTIMFDEWANWFSDSAGSPWRLFFVFVVLGMLAGAVTLSIMGGVARRSGSKLIITMVTRLRSAIFFACTIGGAKFGVRALDLRPETLKQIDIAVTVAAAVVVTWAITRIYRSVHEIVISSWAKRTGNSELADVGHTIISLLIWLVGLSLGLSSAGFDIGAIIAGLGIGGLAVALAAQDAVANIFGGVIILSQEPFKVGNRISVTGLEGWVTKVGLRATVMKNWYGHKITIPNKVFTNNAVANIDDRGEYWEEIPLKLRHDTTLEQVKTAIALVKEILADHPHLRPMHWVGLSKFGEGYIEIEVWYGTISFLADGGKADFSDEYTKTLSVKSEINMLVLAALEREGIHLATPVTGHIIHQETLGGSRF